MARFWVVFLFSLQYGLAAETLLVFSASSTTNALKEIVKKYNKHRVKVSFAASSTLARQIEAGAPADLYISANLQWLAYLKKRQKLVSAQKRLATNKMVLVAHKTFTYQGLGLLKALPAKSIAMADYRHVPAGMYGRAALEKAGLWQALSPKLVTTTNVRAALFWVERNETPLAMVYHSDARISKKVKIVHRFQHPLAVYYAALTSKKQGAADLLNYLQGPQARKIFDKHGFLRP